MMWQISVPPLLVAGVIILLGVFAGRLAGRLHMPTPIGYMVTGILLGPTLIGLISESVQLNFEFIQEIGLGFVALAIGLELNRRAVQGDTARIVIITLAQGLATFAIVAIGLSLLTGNIALSLVFGAIATATAPAGTVAVIREFHARGPVTRTLYAVVGLDDGLSIILYAFASAVAMALITPEHSSFGAMLLVPLTEIGVSILLGAVLGFVFSLLARPLLRSSDLFVLTVGVVFIASGLSLMVHASVIMVAMVMGIVVTNSQSGEMVRRIGEGITVALPVVFVLFFALAGSHLDLAGLPAMGLVGLCYVGTRVLGKIGGTWTGAIATRASPEVRRYLGFALLAQAGVAIGLALKTYARFSDVGVAGADIARIVITTVTAATIIFELVGPMLAKYALDKAGEIPHEQK
jgi:Kef-type K+ transport system membrane component KefB